MGNIARPFLKGAKRVIFLFYLEEKGAAMAGCGNSYSSSTHALFFSRALRVVKAPAGSDTVCCTAL